MDIDRKIKSDKFFLVFMIVFVIGVLLVILLFQGMILTEERALDFIQEAMREVFFEKLDNRNLYFTSDINEAWDRLLNWEELTQGYSYEAVNDVKSSLVYNAQTMAGIKVDSLDEDWYKTLIERLIVLDITTKVQGHGKTPEVFLSEVECIKGSRKYISQGISYDFRGVDFENPKNITTVNFIYDKGRWKVRTENFLNEALDLSDMIINTLDDSN